MVKAARQQQGFVEELANFGNQRKGAPGASVATRASGYGNQAVYAGFSGFFRMASGSNVMKYQAAVAMNRVHQFLYRTEAGDDDGHLVLDADRQVSLQPRVAVVHDQVHGIGRRIVQQRQARFDFFQPGLEAAAFALVERRETPHYPVATAGQDQLRIGDQKHRRGHHGQAQTLFQQSGQRHWRFPE